MELFSQACFRVRRAPSNAGGARGGRAVESFRSVDCGREGALDEMGLSGSLPTSLGSFINLSYLYEIFILTCQPIRSSFLLSLASSSSLWSNSLTGELPSTISALTALSDIVLGFNQLTGSLLQGLSTLSRLSRLALGSNRFAGSLPDWIGGLSLMETLDVSRNNLSGLIPSSIGTLLNLTFLKKTSIPSVAFSAPFLLLLSILPHSITPITALPSIPPITALPSIPPITALPSIPPITALPSVTPMHAGASSPLPATLGSLTTLAYLNIDSTHSCAVLPQKLYIDNTLLPSATTLALLNVDNTSLVCPTTPASCEVPQDPLSVFCVDCATFCSQCSAAGKPLCFLPQLMSHLPVLKSFKDAIQPSSFGS
ncbi:unnamed protein product [Closterium sp. NIES-64]|nr:unnamed protein product [Closterium sp. NIES-64]